jgi:Anaphase-promoting complex subunit 4 WD40 domain
MAEDTERGETTGEPAEPESKLDVVERLAKIIEGIEEEKKTGKSRDPQTKLDKAEQLAKIVGLVAIPIVIPLALAMYSARVQEAAQAETINRDYVQLALSILKEKKDVIDPGIRDWAVDLLAAKSPTQFKPEVIAGLKSGTISLPKPERIPRGWVKSPDSKVVAVWDADGIKLLQIGTRRLLSTIKVDSPVYDMNFSPDGSYLAAGFEDGHVSVYQTSTARVIAIFHLGSEPVTQVSFNGSYKIVAYARGVGTKTLDLTPTK